MCGERTIYKSNTKVTEGRTCTKSSILSSGGHGRIGGTGNYLGGSGVVIKE